MMAALLWAAALLALGLAVWLLLRQAQYESDQSVGQRLGRRRRPAPQESLLDWLRDYLLAAGIAPTPRAATMAGVLALLLVAMVLLVIGAQLTLLLMLLAFAVGNLALRLRAGWLRARLRQQLVPFMEQVMREVSGGQSLELAFRQSARRAPPPLREVLGRVGTRRDLGLELYEALEREARIMQVHELQLLATAIEIAQYHGGSIRHILQSFVDLLLQQDRARRELRALTGETRVTAWVLGAMPLLIAGFMYSSNPEFLEPMLEGGGRLALMLAVSLHLGGCLVLWRMLRSI